MNAADEGGDAEAGDPRKLHASGEKIHPFVSEKGDNPVADAGVSEASGKINAF